MLFIKIDKISYLRDIIFTTDQILFIVKSGGYTVRSSTLCVMGGLNRLVIYVTDWLNRSVTYVLYGQGK